MPCVFVRVTGCNLRCAYCDTAYAYDEGTEMSEDTIIDKVCRYGLKLIEITGGEPLLQGDVLSLASRLLSLGFMVLIETNGTVDIANVDDRAIIIMDVKTPCSGASDSVRLKNFEHLKKSDELKFVLANREDYDWAVEVISKYGLSEKCSILFSPVFGKLSPAKLSGWIIGDRLPVRFNLQMHKYIYVSDMRGV
jgi:7-carboxy-7-deazaguanine synthase